MQNAQEERDETIGIHDVVDQSLILFALKQMLQQKQEGDRREAHIDAINDIRNQNHAHPPFLQQERKRVRPDQHRQRNQAEHQTRRKHRQQEAGVLALVARGLNRQSPRDAGRRQAVADREHQAQRDGRNLGIIAHRVEHEDQRRAKDDGAAVVECALKHRGDEQHGRVNQVNRHGDKRDADQTLHARRGHRVLQHADAQHGRNQWENLLEGVVDDLQVILKAHLLRVAQRGHNRADDEHQRQAEHRDGVRQIVRGEEQRDEHHQRGHNAPRAHLRCFRKLREDFLLGLGLAAPAEEDDRKQRADRQRRQQRHVETDIRNIAAGSDHHRPEVDGRRRRAHNSEHKDERGGLFLGKTHGADHGGHHRAENENGDAARAGQRAGDDHHHAHDGQQNPLVVHAGNDFPRHNVNRARLGIDIHED